MSKWAYEYDQAIPDEDQRVLEEKKDAILGALLYQSLFWQLLKDSEGRNHYRALAYSDRSKVYCQLVIEDIKNLDGDEIKKRLIAGDWVARDIK